jgi:hypothetical protein
VKGLEVPGEVGIGEGPRRLLVQLLETSGKVGLVLDLAGIGWGLLPGDDVPGEVCIRRGVRRCGPLGVRSRVSSPGCLRVRTFSRVMMSSGEGFSVMMFSRVKCSPG